MPITGGFRRQYCDVGSAGPEPWPGIRLTIEQFGSITRRGGGAFPLSGTTTPTPTRRRFGRQSPQVRLEAGPAAYHRQGSLWRHLDTLAGQRLRVDATKPRLPDILPAPLRRMPGYWWGCGCRRATGFPPDPHRHSSGRECGRRLMGWHPIEPDEERFTMAEVFLPRKCSRLMPSVIHHAAT